jgi:hypothetical protein
MISSFWLSDIRVSNCRRVNKIEHMNVKRETEKEEDTGVAYCPPEGRSRPIKRS